MWRESLRLTSGGCGGGDTSLPSPSSFLRCASSSALERAATQTHPHTRNEQRSPSRLPFFFSECFFPGLPDDFSRIWPIGKSNLATKPQIWPIYKMQKNRVKTLNNARKCCILTLFSVLKVTCAHKTPLQTDRSQGWG